jgi:hypothetical protein
MGSDLEDTSGGDERSWRYYARKLKRHPAFRSWKKPLDVMKRTLPSAWRMATHQLRHLPTVIIVGAQKAGTTQLYAHMVKHPRVFAGVKKEVDYFSKQPDRPVAWYRSRFPLRLQVEARDGHVLEASPSYLPMPQALRQMQSVVPDARLIVLLRDPVSRAFSHYQHRKTRHLESRTFEQAVADELQTYVFPARRGVALAPNAQPMLGYVGRGYYALQLELLLALYPLNRVLVIDSAELFSDTSATCRRVFDFLGLEDFDVQPGKVYNRGYYQEKVDPRVAEQLREHYLPYDKLLEDVVGRPFQWMSRRQAA